MIHKCSLHRLSDVHERLPGRPLANELIAALKEVTEIATEGQLKDGEDGGSEEPTAPLRSRLDLSGSITR